MNDQEIAQLNEDARNHLWMHFSRMGTYGPEKEIPIITRGKGAYVWDAHDKEYLDGLSGLFTTQIGHGRRKLGEAALHQAETLDFYPIWTYAHPKAIELATRLASLAPGDLNRVFFTVSGGEAVESAIKLARQYFLLKGQPERRQMISRNIAYHGTSMGALAVTAIPNYKKPFEPLMPGGNHISNTNRMRHPLAHDERAFMVAITDELEQKILELGPETVAAVFMEPVQNAGGCFVPPAGYFQRVREICDKYGVLMVSDEVICAFGRLGTMFGAQKFDYLPDMITCAKGMTSGYAPIGAVIARDFLMEPFLEGTNAFFHGSTYGGHPISCAVALANLEVFEEDSILENVHKHEEGFRERLESFRDIPIVGDVRGAGFFQAIELVRDQETLESFTAEEGEFLLRRYLSPHLYEAGLICRSDDRGDPVVQLAPPLICTDTEFDRIHDTLRTVLTDAEKVMREMRS
ncbi:MAG: aspartate aminotransferase family protein [Acidimicrobiia bacterium]